MKKKSFFHWGWGIAIVYTAFVLFMAFMFWKTTNVNIDMVKKDYYKDELVYQNVIDATERANALSKEVNITQNDSTVVIEFPNEMQHAPLSGKIWFYCAYNPSFDLHADIAVDTATATQHISKRMLAKANYIVKISWQKDSTEYYFEDTYTIKK